MDGGQYSFHWSDVANSFSGTLAHEFESLWLEFSYQQQTIYVVKKYARHSISWFQIYQVGAVYGTGVFGYNPYGTPRLQDAVLVGSVMAELL